MCGRAYRGGSRGRLDSPCNLAKFANLLDSVEKPRSLSVPGGNLSFATPRAEPDAVPALREVDGSQSYGKSAGAARIGARVSPDEAGARHLWPDEPNGSLADGLAGHGTSAFQKDSFQIENKYPRVSRAPDNSWCHHPAQNPIWRRDSPLQTACPGERGSKLTELVTEWRSPSPWQYVVAYSLLRSVLHDPGAPEQTNPTQLCAAAAALNLTERGRIGSPWCPPAGQLQLLTATARSPGLLNPHCRQESLDARTADV